MENKELSSTELIRYQYKWDCFLLTNYFNKPSMDVIKLANIFMQKNNLSFDNFCLLKRIPFYWVHNKKYSFVRPIKGDVYKFIAANLRDIYKYIAHKDITDLFTIAEQLKGSLIDSKVITGSKYAKVYTSKERKKLAAFTLEKMKERNLYGKGSINNLAFFKKS